MQDEFLTDIPRVSLAQLPTPLVPLDRLTDYLSGPRIYVKRDDCTGLATGGNKARKLEFLLGAALADRCDTLVTVGGLQSNHARQTAAAAAQLGLACELHLQEVPGAPEGNYDYNANLLLNDLFDARVVRYPATAFMGEALHDAVDRLRRAGRRPYAVPGGGSNALGALGYVMAVRELLEQCQQQGVTVDQIVVASGSGGTQAGLIAGLAAADSDIEVIGINVGTPSLQQTRKVLALVNETCELLGIAPPDESTVQCLGDYFDPGYGVPNDAMRQAVRLVARLEGVLLDPVYTGKAMAGLIDLVHTGRLDADHTTVFLHTGGQTGLFAYPRDL